MNLQNGPAYCEAFLNVLRNVTKEEAVQYVLALINDMLSGMSYINYLMCNCEGVYAWSMFSVCS